MIVNFEMSGPQRVKLKNQTTLIHKQIIQTSFVNWIDSFIDQIWLERMIPTQIQQCYFSH